MSQQHKSDEKRVRHFLGTKEGEVFLRWLKVETGFEMPIYSPEDNYNETAAKIIDGGRHVVRKLLNLQAENHE